MMHKLIVAWAVIAVGFAVPDDLTATPRWLNGTEGVCEAAPNNADGYTFKTSKGVQRCFYVRRRSTRAAPRGPLHAGRFTGVADLLYTLTCAHY